MSDTTINPAQTATHEPEVHPLTFPRKVIISLTLGLAGSIAGPILSVACLSEVVGLKLGTHADATGKQVGGWDTSPLLVAVIYVTAVAAAWEVGKALASRRTERPPDKLHTVEAVASFVAWFLLALSMCLVRAFETVLTGGDPDDGNADWVIAMLLIILDIIAGICVMFATYTYLTSSFHLVGKTRKKADKAIKESHKASGLALHVVEALDTNRLAASQWASEYQAQTTRLANDAARIKDSVRLKLAEILASPSLTGSVYETHRSTNVTEYKPTAEGTAQEGGAAPDGTHTEDTERS